MKSLIYPIMLLSAWEATDSSQTLQGLLAFAGIGVLVISACMGESARKARTKLMIRKSPPSKQSWATYPSVARSETYLISSTIGSANSRQDATFDVARKWQLYS